MTYAFRFYGAHPPGLRGEEGEYAEATVLVRFGEAPPIAPLIDAAREAAGRLILELAGKDETVAARLTCEHELPLCGGVGEVLDAVQDLVRTWHAIAPIEEAVNVNAKPGSDAWTQWSLAASPPRPHPGFVQLPLEPDIDEHGWGEIDAWIDEPIESDPAWIDGLARRESAARDAAMRATREAAEAAGEIYLTPIDEPEKLRQPGPTLDGYPSKRWRSPGGRTMKGNEHFGLVEDGVPVYPIRARAHYLNDDEIVLVTAQTLCLLGREPDVGFLPIATVASLESDSVGGGAFSARMLDQSLILFDGRVVLARDHGLFPLPGRFDPDAVRLAGRASDGRWCFVRSDDDTKWFALEIPAGAMATASEAPRWPEAVANMAADAAAGKPAAVQIEGPLPFPAPPQAVSDALGDKDLAWTSGDVVVAYRSYRTERHGDQYRAELARDGVFHPIEGVGDLGGTTLFARSNAAPVYGCGRLLMLLPNRRRIVEVDLESAATRTVFTWDETEQLMAACALADGNTLVQLAGIPQPPNRRAAVYSRRVVVGPGDDATSAADRGERMRNASRSVVALSDGRAIVTLTTAEPDRPHELTIEDFDGRGFQQRHRFELPPIAPRLDASAGMFRSPALRPPRLSEQDGRVFVHLGTIAFELVNIVDR